MTIRKSNPYLALVNSYLIDSPQPSSINYWWNLGSLLGLCLVIQLASGIFLAMHYSSNIELAFNSVEHIMRDVNAGWLIRYIHANGASFFFICMYLHIGKALYYGSYKSPRVLVWTVGVIIFILTMATAFMGYEKNNSPKSFSYKPFYARQRRVPPCSGASSFISSKRFYSIKSKPLDIIPDVKLSNYTPKDITNEIDIFNEIGIEPIDWWSNLNKLEVRSNINIHLKNKSGIYIIINKITRNYYVGSASTNRLYTRFCNHLLNYHGSKLIKKSVIKYGLNNFIFAILEYYPYKITKLNNKDLLALETSYISLLIPGYNILTEAGNSFGYKHSEENLLKMKLAFTEERRELLRQLQHSRKNKWSDESKLKLRNMPDLWSGRYTPPKQSFGGNIALNRPSNYLSKDRRINISKKVSLKIQLRLNNEYLCEIIGVNKTSHLLCCSYKTIQRALDLGWIYVPDVFISYLNNNHISNNNDIISFLYKNKSHTLVKSENTHKSELKKKYKSSLVNLPNHTKIYISRI